MREPGNAEKVKWLIIGWTAYDQLLAGERIILFASSLDQLVAYPEPYPMGDYGLFTILFIHGQI
jgi:hypothetical protein